jgi:hypothetical protein
MFKIGYMVFLIKMGAITPPLMTTTPIDIFRINSVHYGLLWYGLYYLQIKFLKKFTEPV